MTGEGILGLSPARRNAPGKIGGANSARVRGEEEPSARTSAQERTLETKLKGGRRTLRRGEHGPEMFEGMPQGIGLGAGGRRLFAAQL